VVSNIFYVHHYLGKLPNLTNIFQLGWVETTKPGARSPAQMDHFQKTHQGFEGFPLPLRNPEGATQKQSLEEKVGFHGGGGIFVFPC